MKKGIRLSITFLLLLASCKSLPEGEGWIKYAEDTGNGLRKTIEVGNVIYTVQFKPAEYIISKEHLEGDEARKRREQLTGWVWFNISLNIRDYYESPLRYKVSSLEEYNERLDYYLNAAPADIRLIYGADSIYTGSYWFENNHNMVNYETMIIGFPLPEDTKKPKEDLQLVFHDRVFKNGIIKTKFRKQDLTKI